jgi:hypothetical protein
MFSCGSKAMTKTVDSPVEAPPASEEAAIPVPEPEPEPESEPEPEPEPELTLDELKKQLKETQEQLEVFDTKAELEAARKKLEKMKSSK